MLRIVQFIQLENQTQFLTSNVNNSISTNRYTPEFSNF